jgi:hypothetical protein
MYYLYTPLPQKILPCLIIARDGLTNRYCACSCGVEIGFRMLMYDLYTPLPQPISPCLSCARDGLPTCNTDSGWVSKKTPLFSGVFYQRFIHFVSFVKSPFLDLLDYDG